MPRREGRSHLLTATNHSFGQCGSCGAIKLEVIAPSIFLAATCDEYNRQAPASRGALECIRREVRLSRRKGRLEWFHRMTCSSGSWSSTAQAGSRPNLHGQPWAVQVLHKLLLEFCRRYANLRWSETSIHKPPHSLHD